MKFFQLKVSVPAECVGRITVNNLHEAHPTLDKAAGRQADLAERTGHFVVESIESLSIGALFRKLEEIWNGGLHAESQLVGFDTGQHSRILGVLHRLKLIEPPQ